MLAVNILVTLLVTFVDILFSRGWDCGMQNLQLGRWEIILHSCCSCVWAVCSLIPTAQATMSYLGDSCNHLRLLAQLIRSITDYSKDYIS